MHCNCFIDRYLHWFIVSSLLVTAAKPIPSKLFLLFLLKYARLTVNKFVYCAQRKNWGPIPNTFWNYAVVKFLRNIFQFLLSQKIGMFQRKNKLMKREGNSERSESLRNQTNCLLITVPVFSAFALLLFPIFFFIIFLIPRLGLLLWNCKSA